MSQLLAQRYSSVTRLRQARYLMLSWCLAIVVIAGCGQGDSIHGVMVKGQVLQSGQPLKVLPGEEITVTFFRAAPAGQKPVGASAIVKPEDATFTIEGPSHHGIPAGSYHISLSSQVAGVYDREDRFVAVFKKKSPLTAEVGPEEGQTFTIDLGKWTVTKP